MAKKYRLQVSFDWRSLDTLFWVILIDIFDAIPTDTSPTCENILSQTGTIIFKNKRINNFWWLWINSKQCCSRKVCTVYLPNNKHFNLRTLHFITQQLPHIDCFKAENIITFLGYRNASKRIKTAILKTIVNNITYWCQVCLQKI